MSLEQTAYILNQDRWKYAYRVNIGTQVKVIRFPELGESGWRGNTFYPDDKRKAVGNIYKVRSILPETVILNVPKIGNMHFPFFVLEVVSVQNRDNAE